VIFFRDDREIVLLAIEVAEVSLGPRALDPSKENTRRRVRCQGLPPRREWAAAVLRCLPENREDAALVIREHLSDTDPRPWSRSEARRARRLVAEFYRDLREAGLLQAGERYLLAAG